MNQRDVSPLPAHDRGAAVAGRYLTATTMPPPKVVINQTLARMASSTRTDRSAPRRHVAHARSITEIVGVVGDVREGAPQDIWPAVYLPIAQSLTPTSSSCTAQAPAGIVPSMAPRSSGQPRSRRLRRGGHRRPHQTSPAYLQRSSACWSRLRRGRVDPRWSGSTAYRLFGQPADGRYVRMAPAPGAAPYRLILREAGGLALVGIVVGLAGASRRRRSCASCCRHAAVDIATPDGRRALAARP